MRFPYSIKPFDEGSRQPFCSPFRPRLSLRKPLFLRTSSEASSDVITINNARSEHISCKLFFPSFPSFCSLFAPHVVVVVLRSVHAVGCAHLSMTKRLPFNRSAEFLSELSSRSLQSHVCRQSEEEEEEEEEFLRVSLASFCFLFFCGVPHASRGIFFFSFYFYRDRDEATRNKVAEGLNRVGE